MVKGLPSISSTPTAVCGGCLIGKQAKKPFDMSGSKRANEVLELVHSDVWEATNESFGGNKYFVSFIDDKSRYTAVYFLNHKSEVLTAFKTYKLLVEKQTGKLIKRLRSDNGGEYTSKEFKAFIANNGISHEFTIPRTPEQNGVAERANRTIAERARSMLNTRNVPVRFWAEAVMTAVQHCPTKLMVADSLTKPVPKDKHDWCAKAMGVVQVSA
jgi:hypothetical protein